MTTPKGKHLENNAKQSFTLEISTTQRDSNMYASIFNAPAKRFILIMHRDASITSEVMQLTFDSKAEAKAEAKRRGLKAWNY